MFLDYESLDRQRTIFGSFETTKAGVFKLRGSPCHKGSYGRRTCHWTWDGLSQMYSSTGHDVVALGHEKANTQLCLLFGSRCVKSGSKRTHKFGCQMSKLVSRKLMKVLIRMHYQGSILLYGNNFDKTLGFRHKSRKSRRAPLVSRGETYWPGIFDLSLLYG